MAEPNEMPLYLAMGVAVILMLVGHYTLKALDPPMPVRVGLGALMLLSGVVAIAVWPGLSAVVKNPLLFGVIVVLLGLGINQIAAPLRRALGRAA